MMNCVKTKYDYIPILSKDYLCVPYTLKIVINATMINDISIDQISSFFSINKPANTHEMNQYGAVIKNDELNKMFDKLNLPLKEEYIAINTIADYEFCDVVMENIKKGHHIMFGYSYGELYRDNKYADLGHVSIITEVDDETITILNPGPDNFGFSKFKYEDIYYAIKRKKDGLWVIKRIEK